MILGREHAHDHSKWASPSSSSLLLSTQSSVISALVRSSLKRFESRHRLRQPNRPKTCFRRERLGFHANRSETFLNCSQFILMILIITTIKMPPGNVFALHSALHILRKLATVWVDPGACIGQYMAWVARTHSRTHVHFSDTESYKGCRI